MHHHLRRPLFVNLSKSHATKLKLVDCWYVLLPRQEVTSRGVQTKVKSCKSELEKEREREREKGERGRKSPNSSLLRLPFLLSSCLPPAHMLIPHSKTLPLVHTWSNLNPPKPNMGLIKKKK